MKDTIQKAGESTSVATKKLVYSALGIALALATSYIKLWKLPMGGSVTLFSMLFICLIGYWFGLKHALITGMAYGLLQFVIDPYMYTIPQVLLDYPLAFGALGLSGLFYNRKYGMQLGYVLGVFGRFLCSTLSGIIFFADYAPEGMHPWVYSIAYQGSYLGIEMMMTLIVISIPPVVKALTLVKKQVIN